MAYNARATARGDARRRETSRTARCPTDRLHESGLTSGEISAAVRRTSSTRMFAQVRAIRRARLIVDLRSNGGGDSRMGDELSSHLTTQPLSHGVGEAVEDEPRVSRAPEVDGAPAAEPSADREILSDRPPSVLRLRTERSCGWTKTRRHTQRANPTFDGPVCVLIGRAHVLQRRRSRGRRSRRTTSRH